jgi:hypothetical protein
LLRTLLAVLVLASVTGRLSAQTTPPVDHSPPPDGEILELERFKVTFGVDVEELVLSIARPFNSEFGTKYSLKENTFFVNFAVYDQKRAAKSTSSTVVQEYHYKVSGLPAHLFNALLSHSFDNGLSLTANTVMTGEMNNNTSGRLVIPWQYTVDVSASHAYKDWDFRVQVLNVTNEENWSPPNAAYGNGSIVALPGTQVQFSAIFNF